MSDVPGPSFSLSFPDLDQVLFPEDDHLKSFLKQHAQAKRCGKGQLALLRYLINWNLNVGVIKPKRHYMDLPYIRSTTMKAICHDYAPIRDACLQLHKSYAAGSHAMHVTGYEDAFISLIARGIFEARARHKSDPTPETTALFAPGNANENYTFSENTHRRFCPLGRMPSETLKRLFPAAVDMDMRNCYANIVINWADDLGYNIPPELRLLRHDRDGFYASLWREADLVNSLHPKDAAGEPRAVAKLLVQKMIHPSGKLKTANGRRKTGVAWYDDLCDWFDAIYRMCGIPREKVHLHLSKVEAQHIQTAAEVVGEQNFLVDRHDGFVCADVPDDQVAYFLQLLEERTGIPWTSERFPNDED